MIEICTGVHQSVTTKMIELQFDRVIVSEIFNYEEHNSLLQLFLTGVFSVNCFFAS